MFKNNFIPISLFLDLNNIVITIYFNPIAFLKIIKHKIKKLMLNLFLNKALDLNNILNKVLK